MYNLFANVNWWIVAVAVVICYIVSSIKIVSEQERAVLVFMGRILKAVESGPHIVLWPLFWLRRAPKNAIKVDFGTLDDQNDISRAAQSDTSISWFVLRGPVRISWGDLDSSGLPDNERKQYVNDPYAKRLTTDPHLYFIFRVHDVCSLVEEAGGLEEAMDRIRDTCVTALSEEAGKTFVAKAIKEIDSLSDKIRDEVEWLVGDPNAKTRPGKNPNRSWGVDVLEVRIKDIGTSHAVNTAVSERSATVAKAAGEAMATELKANAEEIRLTKVGKGEAAAIEAKGAATAGAITARAEAVSSPGGQLIAQLDALKEGIEKGNVTILPADLTLLTTATSLKAAIDALGKKKGG